MGQRKAHIQDPSGPSSPLSGPAPEYIGRFAPTPSGPLHFGSMVAAVGSYLQARVANGKWILRIEDIDQLRLVRGADEEIIRTLAAFGFEWNGQIEYQSHRLSRYTETLEKLRALDLIYSCSCSRSQLTANDEQRYPGTCRNRVPKRGEPVAQRFLVASGPIEFADQIQGYCVQDVAAASGDFIVQRKDGYFAYHLAVVVDDADQGITEVVRGADLLDSTPRHILLQRALSLPTPRYCHLPLAVDSSGQKLSKSAQSIPVDSKNTTDVLWQVLDFLRQEPPRELRRVSLTELWEWAISHWNVERLRRVKSLYAPSS